MVLRPPPLTHFVLQKRKLMDRYNRQPFSANGAYRCIKPFVMSGVMFQLGDKVPTNGIEVRRLRQMYDTRMIDLDQEAADRTPVRKEKAEPAKRAKEPTVQEPVAAPASGDLKAEHRGFGRWYVTNAAGDEIAGPMTKAEAERHIVNV